MPISTPPTGITLTVDGTPYTAADRGANRIKIDRLVKSLDEADTLEFHEYGKDLPPTWKVGTAVEWADAGVPHFKGEVVGVHPGRGRPGWTFGYQCSGLKYVGNKVPITNPFDGTGSITYNLPSDDPDYDPANAGKSVGEILADVFDAHAAALAAAGIAGYVSADLTPLTLVPSEPVEFQGPAFFNAVDSSLDRWAGLNACYLEYQPGTSDWRIRVRDTTAFTPTTLTMDVDPIDPPAIARDSSGTYTRVVYRGRANTETLFTSSLDLTLTPGWDVDDDQPIWTWDDWVNPKGASDRGTIGGLGSTTVTLSSSSGSRAWVTNFWSTNGGYLWAINPVATGITQQEWRRVTACTALTAGGSATVTVDRPFENGGYTRYRMVCLPPGGLHDVWRRYNVVQADALGHLVRKFATPVAWANNGTLLQISYPTGAVVYDKVELPASFEIDAANNQIVFTEPVVKVGNTQSDLDAGGDAVRAPTDVKALIAYGRGTLTAVAPPSGYTGTAYTEDGLERTWYLDAPRWSFAGDQSQYEDLAALKLDTVKDTVVTGTVNYYGKLSEALTLGMAINIDAPTYTTGWEALNAPVRQAILNFPDDGPVNWMTTLQVNNRRKIATGESMYIHPAFTGTAAWEVQGGSIGPEARGGGPGGSDGPVDAGPADAGQVGPGDVAGPIAASDLPAPIAPAPDRPAGPDGGDGGGDFHVPPSPPRDLESYADELLGDEGEDGPDDL